MKSEEVRCWLRQRIKIVPLRGTHHLFTLHYYFLLNSYPIIMFLTHYREGTDLIVPSLLRFISAIGCTGLRVVFQPRTGESITRSHFFAAGSHARSYACTAVGLSMV